MKLADMEKIEFDAAGPASNIKRYVREREIKRSKFL